MTRHFKITKLNDLTSISLPTKVLDSLAIMQLSDELLTFVVEQQPPRLVIDFSDVQRFSSEAIGLMLRVNQRVEAYQGELTLSGMSHDIRRIFKLMRLDGLVLNISDSVQSA